MNNPRQGSAAAHTIQDRRAMVRSGRLALVPQSQWQNHPLGMLSLQHKIRTDMTCTNCKLRVFALLIYWDIVDKNLVAIRKCTRCKHAWEL